MGLRRACMLRKMFWRRRRNRWLDVCALLLLESEILRMSLSVRFESRCINRSGIRLPAPLKWGKAADRSLRHPPHRLSPPSSLESGILEPTKRSKRLGKHKKALDAQWICHFASIHDWVIDDRKENIRKENIRSNGRGESELLARITYSSQRLSTYAVLRP